MAVVGHAVVRTGAVVVDGVVVHVPAALVGEHGVGEIGDGVVRHVAGASHFDGDADVSSAIRSTPDEVVGDGGVLRGLTTREIGSMVPGSPVRLLKLSKKLSL